MAGRTSGTDFEAASVFRVSLTVRCVVSLDMKFRAGHTVGMLVIYMLPPFMAPFFFMSAPALMGVPPVRTALGERYFTSAIPPETSDTHC